MNFNFIPQNKKNDLEVRYIVQLQGVCSNKIFNDLGEAVDFVQFRTKRPLARDTVKKAILDGGFYYSFGAGGVVRITPQYKGTCDKCGCKCGLKRLINYKEANTYICESCNDKRFTISACNHNYESLFMCEDEDEE